MFDSDTVQRGATSSASSKPLDPSQAARSIKRGKRKLGDRSTSETPNDSDPAPSKFDKMFDRLINVIPPPTPQLIHEARLELERQRFERESKRVEDSNALLGKRIELEMQQLAQERERRQRRWEIDNEDRKRRRLIEDEERESRRLEDKANQAIAKRQSQIKFFLELADSQPGESADAFRQHAMTLAAAMAKGELAAFQDST
ncbi:hypothetical protein RhiTH_011693 [Rhizoctonia solani]